MTLAPLVALAFARPAFADTQVGGVLHGSATWTTAGSPYVINSGFTIGYDGALTIDPGVVVKIGNGASGFLFVNGALTAVGTPSSRITFTSLQDDSIGGDSGGDGATSGSPGQWASLYISGGGTATFDYADIRYGGAGSASWISGAVKVTSSSSVTLRRSTITNNLRSGVLLTTDAAATIDQTVVSMNTNGVSLNGTGQATISHATLRDNSNAGLWFQLSSSVLASTSLMDSDVLNNGAYGIDVGWLDSNLNTALLPHGNRNNIYGNAGGAPGKQLYLSYKRRDLDWTQNYWGQGVYAYINPPQCSTAIPPYHHLANASSSGNPPLGPVRSGTQYINGASCAYDYANTGGFDEFVWRAPIDHDLDYDDLLFDLTPELRYDSDEIYSADAANEITDNYDPDVAGYENRLLAEPPEGAVVLAGANPIHDIDPNDPIAHLNLDYLRDSYPDGRQAADTDKLDEADNYEEDFQDLRDSDPLFYGDQSYGRAQRYPNGDGVLQYWFFYYYNPKTFSGAGNHEGDWEMVQIHVDASGNPYQAAYAQHDNGERCSWTAIQTTDDGHPIVYVADGSHASYFTAGPHQLPFGEDAADGLRLPFVRPSPWYLDNLSPDWISWPGQWGGSTGFFGFGASPESPARQGEKWNDAAAWASGLDECGGGEVRAGGTEARHARGATSSSLRAARPHFPPPPTPRVVARRVGQRVVIRYSFDRIPRDKNRRPYLLLTSVHSAGTLHSPYTLRHRVGRRQGRIVRPLGFGAAPFVLWVETVARTGARSRSVAVTLTRGFAPLRVATPPSPQGPQPPAPNIAARRVGRRLIIDYRFDQFRRGANRRPWRLLTVVKSRDRRYRPLTLSHTVRGPRGRITRWVGRGPAPFTLRVQALARTGRASETLTITIDPRTPAPDITARRVGRHAVISYRFRRFPQAENRRSLSLFISVRPSGDEPLTLRTLIRARRGHISVPLRGRSPFLVQVIALTQRTGASRTVTVTIR